jgi:hypothetical protein
VTGGKDMKAKSYVIDEDALVERLLPKIEERVKTDVVRSIISALEEQMYPPESSLKEEFVRRVDKASRSKGKVFKTAKELEAHLKSLNK